MHAHHQCSIVCITMGARALVLCAKCPSAGPHMRSLDSCFTPHNLMAPRCDEASGKRQV